MNESVVVTDQVCPKLSNEGHSGCYGGLGEVREGVEASIEGTFGLALSQFCHLQPFVCSLE